MNNEDDLQSPVIVVVDDEPSLVDMVCFILADAGFTSYGCTQAAEAYWYIQRKRPRLVILDIQMPGLDGISLLQQLRADPATHDLPVIFLTANRHLLDRRLPDYDAHGATLVAKPFTTVQLVHAVQAMLGSTAPP
jgi:DNA-binding response OmpR family regulator